MSLPQGWTTSRLDQIAEVRLGRQRSPKNHSGDAMRPYLRAANVGWRGLKLTDVKTMNFTSVEMDTYRLEPGDILLAEASGSAGEVGKPALWTGEIAECAFQNTLVRVRPWHDDSRYLTHYFRFLAITGQFVSDSRGVGIHHIGRSRLAAWCVPLPPLADQRRIVEILEDHLSRLDAADTNLSVATRRVASLRAAQLARLTSGGANVPLKDLLLSSGYGTSTRCAVDGEGIGVARIPNLVRGRVDMGDLKRAVDPAVDLSRLMLKTGDLLLVRTNGSRDLIGRTAVVENDLDAAFASYLIRLVFDPTRVLPGYAHLALEAPAARRTLEALAASSAGQYNLGLKKLAEVSINVPSLDAQRSVLDAMDASREASDRLLRDLRVGARRGQELRRALLAAAFSGRLTGHASDLDRVEELAAAGSRDGS